MMKWSELLLERLAAEAEEAAEYLRAIVQENDAALLLHALRRARQARGSFDGLNLSAAEMTAMFDLLGEQLPQAA